MEGYFEDDCKNHTQNRCNSSEDIVYDSDSSKCSSVAKAKTGFPLLDEAFVPESDTSSTTSSIKSQEISLIPYITIKQADIDEAGQKLKQTENTSPINSSFEEPYQDSGTDFIPDSDESDEDIICDIRKKKKKAKTNTARRKFKTGIKPKSDDFNQQQSFYVDHLEHNTGFIKTNVFPDETLSDKEKEESYDEEKRNKEESKVPILLATKTKGKRTHDKRNACMYCKLLVSKLPRHLEAKHSNEKEVAEFMAKPLNSKERKAMIEDIRQTGNYVHNSEVIKSGKGIVIPKRRPNKAKEIKNFTPCGYCHGLFDKKYIYLHKRECALKHNVKTGSRKSGKMTLPVREDNACKGLQDDVLSKMRTDELYHIVRMDSLILRFGSELYKRLGNLPHLHVYIAQRMRQLARFLMEIRNIKKEITSLSNSLHPKYYNDFVKAVKCLGKYDEETGSYGIPTLPLRIRTSIQQCAAIYKSDLIIKGQTSKRAQLDDFVTLIEMNYRNQVSSQALNSAYRTKWNKPDVIPMASDISILTTYLKEKATEYVSLLKQEIDSLTWVKLCEITLVQTLLFNRRRSGDVERMYLETYKNRDSSAMNKELENTLTDLEKQIAKNLTRIEVRGKRGRKVPILLPSDLKMQIDLLISMRETVGIFEDNPYLFPSINSINHMRSSDKLREMAGKSGVKDPQSITSTKLRKHVATAAQLLNLKDNEMDSLATYMGHDIHVHRQYYRLPDGVTQLTKVSKLLLAMNSGNLSKNKNKNFDNMSIDENDEPLGLEGPKETEKNEKLDGSDRETRSKKNREEKHCDPKSFNKHIIKSKNVNCADIESDGSYEEAAEKQRKVVIQKDKKVQKKEGNLEEERGLRKKTTQ